MDILALPYHIQKKIYYYLHRSYMREVCADIENSVFFVYYRENSRCPYKMSWWYARNRNYYACLITCDDDPPICRRCGGWSSE